MIAKTGWLDNEYSLARHHQRRDGTPLTFAFYAIRDGVGTDYDAGEAAKAALDTSPTARARAATTPRTTDTDETEDQG